MVDIACCPTVVVKYHTELSGSAGVLRPNTCSDFLENPNLRDLDPVVSTVKFKGFAKLSIYPFWRALNFAIMPIA